VPKENRIGKTLGFKFAMKVLAGGRIGIASQALGIASGAYELALNYSKERKAFGKEIMQHQASSSNWRIGYPHRSRRPYVFALPGEGPAPGLRLSSSMAKVFSSETAMWTTTEAFRFTADTVMSRNTMWRD